MDTIGVCIILGFIILCLASPVLAMAADWFIDRFVKGKLIMKEKTIVVRTARRDYYLTFIKRYWWNKWHIHSISDNNYGGNVISKIIEVI